MYVRKTASEEELSEARRKAALARKNCRGGRPRVHKLPSKSIKVDALDAAVFAAYAKSKGLTMTFVMHMVARLMVYGGKSDPHPDFAPEGWAF